MEQPRLFISNTRYASRYVSLSVNMGPMSRKERQKLSTGMHSASGRGRTPGEPSAAAAAPFEGVAPTFRGEDAASRVLMSSSKAASTSARSVLAIRADAAKVWRRRGGISWCETSFFSPTVIELDTDR